MKKLIAAALALVLAISLCACSGGEDAKKSAAYNKALAALQYNSDGLPTLTVATSPDFAPMEFTDLSRKGDAQYVGFDILLATYIAKELNMKLVIKPMSFDAVQVAVQTGTVDLGISGFSCGMQLFQISFIDMIVCIDKTDVPAESIFQAKVSCRAHSAVFRMEYLYPCIRRSQIIAYA